MPRYQYRCLNCKFEKEEEHSIKEDPVIICEMCLDADSDNPSVSEMVRTPCITSFKLKGYGWPGKEKLPVVPYGTKGKR
jgi:predicted nucleic acid-binding Zn ribbon protein